MLCFPPVISSCHFSYFCRAPTFPATAVAAATAVVVADPFYVVWRRLFFTGPYLDDGSTEWMQPGRGINMGDGWETARKPNRPPVLELGADGLVKVQYATISS